MAFRLKTVWLIGLLIGLFSCSEYPETPEKVVEQFTVYISTGECEKALLLGADGDTRDDFRIEQTEDSIHVLNAPSPAATASLAIGEYISEMAEQKFGLKTAIITE